MGNIHSHLKRKNSNTTKIPKFEPKQSVEDELLYYSSNNVSDIDRQHMHHFYKRYLYNGNFSSPVEDQLIQGGCKVLDVGCGPGTWLLELSNNYQNSFFFGLDIKPVYPQEIKPYNLEFIEADMLEGLPFSDNEFDFVHMETMGFILTNDGWDLALSELIRVTKPGGYIEITESPNNFKDAGPILHKVSEALSNSCLKRNVDLKSVLKLDTKFEQHQNIEKVHRDLKNIIIGPNGGKIGIVSQDLFVLFFTTDVAIENLSGELGISKESFKNMIEKELLKELKQTSPEGSTVKFWAQKKD